LARGFEQPLKEWHKLEETKIILEWRSSGDDRETGDEEDHVDEDGDQEA
jgi:hypothetical protein